MDIQNARAELTHPPKVTWLWLGVEMAAVVGIGLVTFLAVVGV